MTSVYIALIGDVMASRALPAAERARLQRHLRTAIPEFNRRWRAVLAARFAVTLGDEWQCLLERAAPIWEIAHAIRATLPEVEWVIACGRGALTTPLGKGIAAPEVDGPCFHDARAALDTAKREKRLFGFRGFGPRRVRAQRFRQLLRCALLELDPAAAPGRQAAPPGRSCPGRQTTSGQPQRRVAPRGPDGLATRDGGR